jgi:hypothetical protein
MYFTKKRSTEYLLWAGILFAIALINTTTEIIESIRDDVDLAFWEPFVGEFSSVFIIAWLVPGILYVDQRMPIAGGTWFRRALIHLPLSMVFSMLHISGMVALRKFLYGLMGETYDYGSLTWLLVYEYRKDLAVYVLILAALYAYREIIRLRSGEAQLPEPAGKKSNVDDENRILVTRRGLFHFIEPGEVDWVEAAGNYVELHVGTETYMLRGTMKNIESRLGNMDFARIHRSTIIRRGLVEHMVSASNGDKIVKLTNNMEFRLSRRYRQNFGVLD